MEKEKIDALIASDIFSSIDGVLIEDVAKQFIELKEKYELKGWENIYVSKEYDYESTYHNLIGLRLETDDEFSNRVKKEQKELERKKIRDDKKIEQERKQYEKLKKKFEDLK